MDDGLLTDQALDLIFRAARTANAWQDIPVAQDTLKRIYDVMKFGPTSANCCPMRIVFIQSAAGKARLRPILDAGNVDKTMAAPVTALIAHDMKFYERLPFLFPHADARSWFEGNAPLIAEAAFRNGTLQGAYFMIAARAFGLDCGPMSGFDQDKADQEFFKESGFRSNFLCNLGYADHAATHPRGPRLSFEDVCQFA